MQQVLPGVFLVPQNGGKGFGYSHFVKRPAGNLILDASRVGSISEAFDGALKRFSRSCGVPGAPHVTVRPKAVDISGCG
jgi:hypothetical protein